jgi:hypothetical protein
MHRRQPLFLFLCALCVLSGSTSARAQEELELSVRRNFGYGGGSQIQGSFRMEIDHPPAGVVSVTFKINDSVVGTDTEPPFRVDFNTDRYPNGWHNLVAVGQTAEGRTLTSAVRRFEFVAAEVGYQVGLRIAGVVFGVVGALIAIGLLSSALTARRRKLLPPGAARRYGWLGGAVCPKCGRPFSTHWWALNTGLSGKLDRCDYCGKWSLVRRASREQLAAAEAAERAQAQPEATVAEPSAEEKLRRQLDESRYIDN